MVIYLVRNVIIQPFSVQNMNAMRDVQSLDRYQRIRWTKRLGEISETIEDGENKKMGQTSKQVTPMSY